MYHEINSKVFLTYLELFHHRKSTNLPRWQPQNGSVAILKNDLSYGIMPLPRCLPILACFENGSVYPYIYLSIDLYLPIAIYIHIHMYIYIVIVYILLYNYIYIYILYIICKYIYIYIFRIIYTIHIPGPSPKVLHPRPSHLLVVKANPQALMLVEPIWEMKAKLRPRMNMKRGQGCI